MRPALLLSLLSLLALAACGRSGLLDPADEVQPQRCRVEITPNDYVRLDFPQQRCTFTLAEAAAGITFRYGVRVIADEPAYVESYPPTLQSCPTTAGNNLYLFERVGDADHSWCECDTGRCARAHLATGAAPGRIERTVTWHGREWAGPSDTGNPEGAAFPPGDYVFTAETSVADARAWMDPIVVTAKLHFTLTP